MACGSCSKESGFKPHYAGGEQTSSNTGLVLGGLAVAVILGYSLLKK